MPKEKPAFDQGLLSVLITAPQKTLAEILREAESKLDAQLQISLAADSRAMAFMAFLAAIAAGALAAFVSTQDQYAKLVLASAFGGFMLAAAFGINAWRPRDIYAAGNLPVEWKADIETAKSFHASIAEQICHYQCHIQLNRLVMRQRNFHLEVACAIMMITMLISGGSTMLMWL